MSPFYTMERSFRKTQLKKQKLEQDQYLGYCIIIQVLNTPNELMQEMEENVELLKAGTDTPNPLASLH